jgi:hypothetical protein
MRMPRADRLYKWPGETGRAVIVSRLCKVDRHNIVFEGLRGFREVES